MKRVAVCLLLLGAAWGTACGYEVVFTTGVSIAAANLAYDHRSILVDGAVLTIDGAHGFTSLCLTNGARLTHSPGTAGLCLAISNDVFISAGSALDVSGLGTAGGPGLAPYHADASGGGGYGGIGGTSSRGGSGGGAYGSLTAPLDLGSRGGSTAYVGGGLAGGAVRLIVAGTLAVDGAVSADGWPGFTSAHPSGGGSGGSVWITAGTLAGMGVITANGGAGVSGSDTTGGGGGGRMAIVCGTNLFGGEYTARGGAGLAGGAGTIWLSGGMADPGSLMVDNAGQSAGSTPLLSGATLRALEIRRGGRLLVSNAIPLTVANLLVLRQGGQLTLAHTNAAVLGTPQLVIEDGTNRFSVRREAALSVFSNVTVRAGAVLAHAANTSAHDWSLALQCLDDLTLEAGGAVDASGSGFDGSFGPGAGAPGADAGGGGGYGGVGGRSLTGAAGGTTYGSHTEPQDLGSSGGYTAYVGGGTGGGAIRFAVGGRLNLNGRIAADGRVGRDTTKPSGGSAGGSIWLTAAKLVGTGTISANGGDGVVSTYYAPHTSGGGGGGRVALYYGTASGFNFSHITVRGGTLGSPVASNGTLSLSGPPQAAYVAACSPTGFVRAAVSNVDVTFTSGLQTNTFTLDDVALAGPTGLVGLASITQTDWNLFRIAFAGAASAEGVYTVSIGPGVQSTNGLDMDQNLDGVCGEPADAFLGTFVRDVTPPDCPAVTNCAAAPATNVVGSASVVIEGSREDGVSVWVGGSLRAAHGSGRWSCTAGVSEGLNEILLWGEDRAGNRSLTNRLFFLADFTPPAVLAVHPADGAVTNSAAITLEIEYAESGSGLDAAACEKWVRKGGVAVPGTWSDTAGRLGFVPAGALADGGYDVGGVLRDRAGCASAPFSSVFYVDRLPPAPPAVDPVTSPTIVNHQLVTGTKEANTAVYRDGVLVAPLSAGLTWGNDVPLVEGLNALAFTARDAAGNVSAPAAVSIVFDNSAPGAVTNLTIETRGSGTELLLDWRGYDEEANGGDIAAYTVLAAPTNFALITEATAVATNAAGEQTFALEGLIRGVTGYYAVVAADWSAHVRPEVVPVAAAPEDVVAPPDPTDLRFDCEATRLTLCWTPSADPHADLAGYRVYATNELAGAAVPAVSNLFVQDELAPACRYPFRVASVDETGNESAGACAFGYTLLVNPSNVAAEAYSGSARLFWDGVSPASNVGHYAVYQGTSAFASVSGRAAALAVTGTTAAVAGLENGKTYYFAVTAVNGCGGERKEVVPVDVTPASDTAGPVIGSLSWDGWPLSDPISAPGTFRVEAADPAGMSRVEFSVEGRDIGSEAGSGPAFACFWDVSKTERDGAFVLRVVAHDTLGNHTLLETNVTVALAVPAAPTIHAPAGGSLGSDPQVRVTGSADPYAERTVLYVNGERVATNRVSGGEFEFLAVLREGTNALEVAAANRAGEGLKSGSTRVVLDTSVPPAPDHLEAASREAGMIALSWWRPPAASLAGYHVYTATAPFSSTGAAARANPALLTAAAFHHLPAAEGTNYYAATCVNPAGTESPLCACTGAVSDATPPRVESVSYTTTGLSDPATGRFGTGRLRLVLTASEPLLTAPFLSLVPEGGAPTSLTLNREADGTYAGVFEVLERTPNGRARLSFSGRDRAGNRGTEIAAGGSVLLDTEGPAVAEFTLTPAAPIRNGATGTVSVAAVLIFATNDLPSGSPALSYSLSLSQTNPVAVAIEPLTDNAWAGTFALPSGAGAEPEMLRFAYQARDDLGNIGTQIVGESAFQVYQGDLPPLDPPAGFTAVARAAGVVELAWSPVEGAADYEIHRRAPAEAGLTPLARSAGAAALCDHPPEGTNWYAVASVRRAHGQEALSALTEPVAARADATAPAPPGGLALFESSAGIGLAWRRPADSGALRYALYRADTPLGSVGGLTPLARDLTATNAVDPDPLAGAAYYAVTAWDEAGNESAPCAWAYTNISLLPVNTLAVSRAAEGLPVISWSHAHPAAIDGYHVYSGVEGAETRLNAFLVPGGVTAFMDAGYDGLEKRYSLRAVDSEWGLEVESMARSLLLPALRVLPPVETPLRRGVMNRLTYTVVNDGATAVTGAVIRVTAAAREHASEPFGVAPFGTSSVAAVVGGYSNLPDVAVLTCTLGIEPSAAERVSLSGFSSHEVVDDLLTAELLNDPFVRGGTGRARFVLHNTCGEEIEIVTARGAGAQPSDEIRFKLADADGSVLSVAAFRQSLGGAGSGLITLADGTSVARVPAGGSFASGDVELAAPSNAPVRGLLQLEIDRMHYHLGRPDAVTIAGLTSKREIRLADVPYDACVTNIRPAVSLGGEPIEIEGRVSSRGTGAPVRRAPLRLTVSLRGFERAFDVFSDDGGRWAHTFRPLEGEAGEYAVWATHPALLDKAVQGTFSINRVVVAPQTATVEVARNYEYCVPLRVGVSAGLILTNLQAVCRPADQPSGALPAGLHVISEPPVARFGAGGTATVRVRFWGDRSAADAGTLVAAVTSDGAPYGTWGWVTIRYTLAEAVPVLAWAPSYLETGVAVSNRVAETLRLHNRGLAELEEAEVSLLTPDERPAPAWIFLNGPSRLGTLAPGEGRDLLLTLAPGGGVAVGDYEFKVRVVSSNHPPADINVFAAVDGSGEGSALFRVIDMFTGYDLAAGGNTGVAGATVALEKQEGSMLLTNLVTGADGEAWFWRLPVGLYRYRVGADGHGDQTGILSIRPGVALSQEVFLDYGLVTLTWEVVPVTLEDRYEIVLSADFKTDVPAAVVVASPPSVQLPEMKAGDVFTGEIELQNHGLIRAFSVRAIMPPPDGKLRCELLTDPPENIEAHGTVRLPYRVTRVASGDDSAGGSAAGPQQLQFPYEYTCANGHTREGCASCVLIPGDRLAELSGLWLWLTPGGGIEIEHYGVSGTNYAVSGYLPRASPSGLGRGDCVPVPPACSERNACRCRARGEPVGSTVNLTTARFEEECRDLQVKVAGGHVVYARFYDGWTWGFNRHWADLVFGRGVDGSLREIELAGVVHERADAEGVVFRHGEGETITAEGGGFRWEGADGAWKAYDAEGRLRAYGDRNDVRVTLAYDEEERLAGVLDHFSNQVLWISHDASNRVSAVSDAAAGGRTVRYAYDGEGRLAEVQDVLGRSTVYGYDSHGRLTGVQPAEGAATSIAYDEYDQVSRVSSADGGVKEFQYGFDRSRGEYFARVRPAGGRETDRWYDADGGLMRQDLGGVTVAGGSYGAEDSVEESAARYGYDAWGNVTRVAYADGTEETFAYDADSRNPLSARDRLGALTEYRYDARGLMTQQIEAVGLDCERVSRFAYDALGQLVRESVGSRTAETAVVEREYDARGNCVATRDAAGNVTSNAYDLMGNCVARTDERGHVWRWLYDAAGRLVAGIDPGGYAVSNEYDAAGHVKRQVDSAGRWTSFERDAAGRLVAASNSLGDATAWEYDAGGRLVRETDAEGRATIHAYDDWGRLTSTTADGGHRTLLSLAYDAAGRVTNSIMRGREARMEYEAGSGMLAREVHPGFARAYRYDAEGFLCATVDECAGEGRTNTWARDALGRVVSATDAEGRTTASSYDALGRLTAVVDGRGCTNRFEYDLADNPVALVDGNGNETRYERDGEGRLVRRTYADGSGAVYRYDPAGNLSEFVNARGQKAEYGHDPLGRLTSAAFYASVGATLPSRVVGYAYDIWGRLVACGDGVAGMDVLRDDTNRMRTVTCDFGPFSRAFAYGTDRKGRKTAYVTPDGATISYHYDGDGRLAAVVIPGEGTLALEYDDAAGGGLCRMVLPGGTVKTVAYDPWLEMATNCVRDVAGNELMRGAYERNRVGCVEGRRTEHGDYAYAYDAADQLTGADQPVLDDEAYLYDGAGNRLTAAWGGGRVEGYTADALNQCVSVVIEEGGLVTNTYAYDTDGNLTQRVEGGVTNVFEWDIEGRLTAILDGAGGVVARYGYDPFGCRVLKAAGGETNYFLYADEGLVGEYDGAGNEIRSYGYAPGSPWMSHPLWLRSVAGGGTNYYYFLCDHLGAPQKLVNKNGAVVWSAFFESFGRAVVDPASTVTNPLRCSSQYFDAESGLHYNTHRYYDPRLGRYLSRDPAGESQGPNLYAFVQNAPLSYVDPLGLALYAFDGTWNDREKMTRPTNVAKLIDVYRGLTWYERGVGTDWQTRHVGGLTGAGGRNRIERMYAKLVKYYNTPDPMGENQQIDVIGFSRGAALARTFVNYINKKGGVPTLGPNGQPTGAKCPVRIRFLGLFDTVASFGLPGNSANIGQNLSIPRNVDCVRHAVALDEKRGMFPLSSVVSDPDDPFADPRIWEQGFRGAHSDIGGGYEDGDRSNYALRWMRDEGVRAGVPFGPLPVEDMAARNPVMHDERGWWERRRDRPREIYYPNAGR